MSNSPLVGILMGSVSDADVMREVSRILDEFGVSHDFRVLSAHRSPDMTLQYAREAESRGIQVLIAGAGAAAHLAGALAAHSILPVIGIPLDSSPLKGMDALLATVQMPGGVPVATMAIGKAGARNAGLFAVQILSRSDPRLQEALVAYKESQRRKIESIQL